MYKLFSSFRCEHEGLIRIFYNVKLKQNIGKLQKDCYFPIAIVDYMNETLKFYDEIDVKFTNYKEIKFVAKFNLEFLCTS